MRKTILFLFLLAAGIYFFPNMLSTTWGKNLIKTYLEHHLDGQIEIDHLSLSWFDNQICKNVRWIKDDEHLECSLEEIICHASLVDCLFSKNPSLDLYLKGGKITSSEKVKFLRKEKNLAISFTPVQAKIVHGRIDFESTEVCLNEKLKFLMEGRVDLPKKHLDIQLGIPSETLKKAFGMKKLSPGYLLEVPLSCPINAKALERKLFKIFLKQKLFNSPKTRSM